MKVSVVVVAKELSVTTQTIRLWEKKGLISPAERTLGGHRRYDLEAIKKSLGRG